MARPIVAIVGRPNVGKSTLFNRLIGQRKAMVDAQAGLTRDRLYGVAEWRGREFSTVDTAGLDLDTREDPSRAAIEAQTQIAIDQADVILLLLDVRQGLTPIDRDIASMLRKSRRRVLVAANKADAPNQRHLAHELLELGFDEPSLISAQHGLGVGELLDRILETLPPAESEPRDEQADRLAIMGRPNVGKSSLLNALLGDERALVSPTPGTTRDPIDTDLVFDGVPVVLVDTAGIRRKSSSRERLERYSLLRGIHAMERADAVLLVIDGSAGVLAQDQHVAGYALEAGKGLVIVVNKIDLVPAPERKPAHWRQVLAREFKFAPYAPAVMVSALTRE
ncbi:MAG TPA: ribosome biogenesis GTPase Der, partial [Candidatus Dormibacteraeota bacterium]|nr:ribosome biogenesis GTPase Der [Candidatus Dormibacteraeota bacterium]